VLVSCGGTNFFPQAPLLCKDPLHVDKGEPERVGGLGAERRTKPQKTEAEMKSEGKNWAASHGGLCGGQQGQGKGEGP
jgi:hypothetical protein